MSKSLRKQKEKVSDDGCVHATDNPGCPYVMQIQQGTKDIALIKRALIGDLESKSPGLIEDFRGFRKAVVMSLNSKWRAKDYGTLLLGLAALVTAVVASIK